METVRDDHFDDLLGKPGGMGQACGGSLWGGVWRMGPLDPDWTSVPNSLGGQLNHFSGRNSQKERREARIVAN